MEWDVRHTKRLKTLLEKGSKLDTWKENEVGYNWWNKEKYKTKHSKFTHGKLLKLKPISLISQNVFYYL